MGHDITAYLPGVDQDKLGKELDLDNYDSEGWSERYEEYLFKVAQYKEATENDEE